MIIATKRRLLVGTACLTLTTGFLYGCKDFLSASATPQGTLDESTLGNRAGVEATLVGAYRPLDCTSVNGNSAFSWGCAASNWVWGSVTSDDSYKGSTGSDQPP